MITGLTALGLPAQDVCGLGSEIRTQAGAFGITSLVFTGGSLAGGGSCTFSVSLQVPTGVPGGSYFNQTSEITALVDERLVTGNPAEDNLIVLAAPTLRKSFANDPVAPGSPVTLEFTLSYNENAPSGATAITFDDDLDDTLAGLAAVGLPAADICGPGSLLTGTTSLSFSGGSLAPSSSCTFSVTLQVPAAALPGSHTNTTSNVIATSQGMDVTADPASDVLEVRALTLAKTFTADPAVPGGTTTLEFTLSNQSPISGTTDLAFNDDLDALLPGMEAIGLPASGICGTGSQMSGTNLLAFTGGVLGPGASCTFSVTLKVPATSPPGEYTNITSPVTADLGGSPITASSAMDDLSVIEALSLTKSFTDDPVVPGGQVTLEFSLSNAHPTESASQLAFTDNLDDALSGLAAIGLPATDICGSGSQIAGTNLLTFSGGSLGPGETCTFAITLQVPADAPFGTTASNTTSPVFGEIGGAEVMGTAATDDLQVDFFTFTKSFDGPTFPGGTSTLTFTIENLDPNANVSPISFSDDLDAVLPGLAAIGLPASGVCGSGSQLTGTSLLTLSVGNLGPGASCTFSVTLQVPQTALPGSFPNTTSALFLAGKPASSPAMDTLIVNARLYLPGVFKNEPAMSNRIFVHPKAR